jgi:hypothetical protein
MIPRHVVSPALAFALAISSLVDCPVAGLGAEPASTRKDPSATRIVLVAGSNVYKPGEHEYRAGCAVLADLLRQTHGVEPVVTVDWPETPASFAGARAIVLFFDGADKHAFVDSARLAQVRTLAESGVGLVSLHQDVDVPKDLGDATRALFGAAWEKGYSQRAHWVARFRDFSDHPIFRGVTPFEIDDGWLFRLRFVPELKGVTPLLRTLSPKTPVARETGSEDIVSWAYDRPGGGRSFVFTGGHLHRSLADEGYRRFLVNGILWSAAVPVPARGAPVVLDAAALDLGREKPATPKTP